MAISVDIFVKDTQAPSRPIEGVVVNVYDASTLSLVASNTTTSVGQAAFLLPGSASPGTNYEVRLFKSGVIFSNPQRIAVIEPVTPPQTNVFDVSGTLTSLPVATDPRLCRCTGQFVDFRGLPIVGNLLRITAIQDVGSLTPASSYSPTPPTLLSGFQVPKVLDGKMVASQTLEAKTDQNGRISVDLIRLGQFYISFAGEEDVPWCVSVPDRSSVNLIDLIHPQPVTLTWNSVDAPYNAVALTVGATANINFELLFSNFYSYSKELGHIIQFTNSDSDVGDVSYDSANGQVVVTGKQAGTLEVTVSVQPNMTPSRVPAYSITAVPLVVTVS